MTFRRISRDAIDRRARGRSLSARGQPLTLVQVVADEDLRLVEVRLPQQVERVLGQEDAVDRRRGGEAQDAPVAVPLLHRYGLGVDGAHAGHDPGRVLLQHRRVAAAVLDQHARHLVGLLRAHVAPGRVERAALQDAAAHQAPGHRRHEVQRDRAAARRLAEDADQAGVAAEDARVVLEPLERHRLVPEAHVARRLLARLEVLAEVEEAEGAHAVLHGGDDAVAARRHHVRVVDVEGGGAGHVAAAVDPDQDRHAGLALGRLAGALVPQPHPPRHPDVHVEAVLADVGVGVPHLLALEAREVVVALLHAAVGQRRGVEHAVPGLDRGGLAEAQRADRRPGERHPVVDVHVALEDPAREAAHEAAARLHDERVLEQLVPGGVLDALGAAAGAQRQRRQQQQQREAAHGFPAAQQVRPNCVAPLRPGRPRCSRTCCALFCPLPISLSHSLSLSLSLAGGSSSAAERRRASARWPARAHRTLTHWGNKCGRVFILLELSA